MSGDTLVQIDARFLKAILEDADLDKTFALYDEHHFNVATMQIAVLRLELSHVDNDDILHIHN